MVSLKTAISHLHTQFMHVHKRCVTYSKYEYVKYMDM